MQLSARCHQLIRIALTGALILIAALPLRAAPEPLRVYIDADFTISYEVGSAIALGVRTALKESNFQIAGVPVQIVDRNHKGRVKRSYDNLRNAVSDRNALAVFGGMHSPPYLQYRDFINRSNLPTLLPWSAAGPITRADPETENWIFRLSVDDSKAGAFLVHQAVQAQGCERLALLLVDTAWGRVNRQTMLDTLARDEREAVYVKLFPTAIGEPAMRQIVSEVKTARADCAIVLAQATEAAYLSHALHDLQYQITVLSHWAILGARYPQSVGPEVRDYIGLQVLQSCGLRVEQEGSPALTAALGAAGFEIDSLSEIPAPAGFVHGYDLGRIFMAAAEQAAQSPEWLGSILDKRRSLKVALESLQTPVRGILKLYERPFAAYGPANPDAHEALGADDLCMAIYDSEGQLRHATPR